MSGLTTLELAALETILEDEMDGVEVLMSIDPRELEQTMGAEDPFGSVRALLGVLVDQGGAYELGIRNVWGIDGINQDKVELTYRYPYPQQSRIQVVQWAVWVKGGCSEAEIARELILNELADVAPEWEDELVDAEAAARTLGPALAEDTREGGWF